MLVWPKDGVKLFSVVGVERQMPNASISKHACSLSAVE